MRDNKAKAASSSRLQQLTDEALFIQRFHHASVLSPDAVRAELEALAYQPGKLAGVFFPRRRKVYITAVDDQHYTFEIKTKVGGLYTELRTRGHINYNSATGKTSVTGAIKFDPVYMTVLVAGLFFLLTWVLASLTRTGGLSGAFILFTLGLTNLFYFRQMFVDRNDLLQTLTRILSVSDLSSARDRLATSQADADTSYMDDDEGHQRVQNSSRDRLA